MYRDRLSHKEQAGQPPVIPGLVSTIIPVYNRAAMLIEAVTSVLCQTYRPIEIIVADDGSTDETAAVCADLAQAHGCIRTVRIRHCARPGLVREAGRRLARGEYLQYLDSDDLLHPSKLELMITALQDNPDCDIAYCATRRYHLSQPPNDEPCELTGQARHQMLPGFLRQRFWMTSTPVYTRRACDLVGPWSDLGAWEDLEYDMRMACLAVKLCHRAEILTDIRDHDLPRLSPADWNARPESVRREPRALQVILGHALAAGLEPGDTDLEAFSELVAELKSRCRRFALQEEAAICDQILAVSCA